MSQHRARLRVTHPVRCRAGALLTAVVLATGLAADIRPAWATEPLPTSVSHIAVDDGRLTLAVRDVPLAELLGFIGERAALQVTVWGGAGPLVTDAFTDLLLDEGIMRLVRGHALVLTYRPSPDGTGSVPGTE